MKYCIKFGSDILPISEDEIEKVLKAMATKSIVVLKCGILNGFNIGGILRDVHAERGFHYGHKFTGEDRVDRKDFIMELPDDLKKALGNDKKLLK